jgi:protein-disulfide isomerase
LPILSRRPLLLAALSLAVAGPAFGAPGVAGPEDMSLGNSKAPIKVVEYASLSCPHCGHFNNEVFPAFKSKYIDTGRVQYTLKEFLTAPEEVAAAGFMMARCAGPSKYFKVVDEVFRSQARWGKEPLLPIFTAIAKANGLSDAQFEACLKDETARKALDARVTRHYEQDGVNGTPTFFVNGKAVEGDPTLATLDAAIAAAAKPAAGRR